MSGQVPYSRKESILSNKVLLINPPFARLAGLEQDYVPMALWHISTLLKQQGFDPYIKNLNIKSGLHYVGYLERTQKYSNLMSLYDMYKSDFYEELNDAIKQIKPDIIGFTVLTPQIKIVNDLTRYIKFNYNIPIFCGGAGATLNYFKINNCNLIYLGGVSHLKDIDSIENYTSTIIADQFTFGNYKGNLNLDGILDKYSPDGYGHVFSSVGCYANCRFCASPAIWHRKVYFKPIDSFLIELKLIADKFNPNKFQIWDENFTASTHRLKLFCERYDLGIPWMCDSRIVSLNENKIKLMKQSGCMQIAVGAESGCQRILDYLNKGVNTETIKHTFDLLNKYEMKSKAYMIIGFPEETETEILESIEFIKSCNPTSIVLSLFTPYTHTLLYNECVDKGLINAETYDESDHSHQSGTFMKQIHPEIHIENIIKLIDDYNFKGGK